MITRKSAPNKCDACFSQNGSTSGELVSISNSAFPWQIQPQFMYFMLMCQCDHLFLICLSAAEYPMQWLVLTTNSIKCYDSESDTEPKSAMSYTRIINFSKHQNDK